MNRIVERFSANALDYDAISVNAFTSALRKPLLAGLSEGRALERFLTAPPQLPDALIFILLFITFLFILKERVNIKDIIYKKRGYITRGTISRFTLFYSIRTLKATVNGPF